MIHPDENALDVFVQNPFSLSEKNRTHLENHVHQCAPCRALVTMLAELYTAAHRRENGDVPDALIDQILPLPQTIVLARSNARSLSEVALASGLPLFPSDSAERDFFSIVASLVSVRYRALLQIGRDRRTGSCRMSLYADDPRPSAGAIISIPDLAARFVLDEHAHAEFRGPGEESPLDWSALTAVVRYPIATGTIALATCSSSDTLRCILCTLRGSYEVEVSTPGKSIDVKVHSSLSAPPVHMVTIDNGAGLRVLMDLDCGHASVHQKIPPGDWTLRLYL